MSMAAWFMSVNEPIDELVAAKCLFEINRSSDTVPNLVYKKLLLFQTGNQSYDVPKRFWVPAEQLRSRPLTQRAR